MLDGFRGKAGEGHHQEGEGDHSGQYPERDGRKQLQAWDQVGIVHVKSRPQDGVGPDHADEVSHDPLLPDQAPNPWVLTKTSCGIPAESQAIAERSQREEVGIGRPALDREDDRGEKHDRIGPQIACSPAVVSPAALGRAESQHSGHARREPRQGVHHERKEKGEWKAIDHRGFPFRPLSLCSYRAVGKPPPGSFG